MNRLQQSCLGIAALGFGAYYVHRFWGSPVDVLMALASIGVGLVLLTAAWVRSG